MTEMKQGVAAVEHRDCTEGPTTCRKTHPDRCVTPSGKETTPHVDRWKAGGHYADGYNSREDEVAALTADRDDLRTNVRTLTTEITGLNDQVATVTKNLEVTTAERDTLKAQNTDLSRRVTEAADDLAGAQRKILDLQNQVAALTKSAGPLIGAHYDTTSVAARGLVDMPIQRTYNTGMPATFAQHEAHEDVGKRISWLSIKPDVAKTASGELDAAITAFIKSIPAGHPCMITCQHEPENPSKKIDPATFVKAQVRFYGLVKAVRPDILVGPIYMQGIFGSYPAPRDWANWGVPKGSMDFLGFDSYNPYMLAGFGNKPTWVAFPPAPIAKAQQIADSHGIPLAIGEFGSAEDPADPQRKIGYAKQVLDYAVAHKLLAVCYFDSPKSDVSPSIVLDSTPQFKAFWNAAVKASPLTLR